MNINIKYINSCPSTNTTLKNMVLEQKAKSGSVLVAQEQTTGRGRFNRSWVAPKGNLNLSMAIDSTKTQKPYLYNLITGYALSLFIQETYELNAKLKWPNDVLIDNLKVAGILSESLPDHNIVIIGVGLNLNSNRSDFPLDLQPSLTTLKEKSDKKLSIQEVISLFLNKWKDVIHIWNNSDDQTTIQKAEQNLAWLNQPVTITNPKKTTKGTLKGLDENGFLLIETNSDKIETIISGDLYKAQGARHKA